MPNHQLKNVRRKAFQSINRKWSYISVGWANQMAHSPNVMRTIVNHDVDTHPEVITLPY